ncbi:hypothetical protein [Neisseria cinerea]|uniref:hypothetical protein n=1 Tax=Neisseria cinerea TaxID=483 RepID=UPI002B1E4AF7|nr:hypothetical protein [Neisseria cinerea]
MSLSTEEKQLYAVFIHNVYNGAIHADADDITPEVADICDKLATAIAQCSQKMVWPEAMFREFYGRPFLSLRAVLKALKKLAQSSVKKWIETVATDRRYRICMATAALNWRSALEMELMGI